MANNILITKEYEGFWVVYNKETGETAEIRQIKEYNALENSNKKRYRVDKNGETISSMIDHFQTAKKIAKESVL